MTRLTWDQIGHETGDPTRFFNVAPNTPAAPAVRGMRAFFGEAALHGQQVDGSVTGGSWLQAFPISSELGQVTIDGLDYGEDLSRVVSVSNFGVAITGASRTSGSQAAIGIMGIAVNEQEPAIDGSGNPITPQVAWGGYIEVNRTRALAEKAIGLEINATQTPAPSAAGPLGPYAAKPTDWTNVLRIAAGSDGRDNFVSGNHQPGQGVFPRSYAINAGITFANNGGAMHEGIVFEWNALLPEGATDDTKIVPNGFEGFRRAMSLPFNAGIRWFSRDSATGPGEQEEVVRLYSVVTNPTRKWAMEFSDGAFSINEREGVGRSLFRVNYRGDAANFITISAGAADGRPVIAAEGLDTNISLRFEPKGVGRFSFRLASVPNYTGVAAALADTALAVEAMFRVGSALHIKTEQT